MTPGGSRGHRGGTPSDRRVRDVREWHDAGTGQDSQTNIFAATVPGLVHYAIPINRALAVARQLDAKAPHTS